MNNECYSTISRCARNLFFDLSPKDIMAFVVIVISIPGNGLNLCPGTTQIPQLVQIQRKLIQFSTFSSQENQIASFLGSVSCKGFTRIAGAV